MKVRTLGEARNPALRAILKGAVPARRGLTRLRLGGRRARSKTLWVSVA